MESRRVTRVRVGVVMTLVGAAFFAWGTLTPPIMSCTNYSGHDYGSCSEILFQVFAVIGGAFVLLAGLVTLLTAAVRHYRTK
jgi:hypothetical protein